MDDRYQSLADAIGRCIVSRDFEGLRGSLAPWLYPSLKPETLAQMVDEANEGLAPPVTWTASEGYSDLAELRTPDDYPPFDKPFPKEITDSNFRGWFSIQFQPDPDNPEGFNVCFDIWFAAVELQGSIYAGHFVVAEAT